MSFGSRLLRGLIAASTLHLMLAAPARACLSETMTTAPAPQAMPMSHAGHDMAGMPAPSGDQNPASETSGSPHKPCCPVPASGCQGSSCLTSTVAALTVTTAPAPITLLSVPRSPEVARLASFAHAPEPPPPRA